MVKSTGEVKVHLRSLLAVVLTNCETCALSASSSSPSKARLLLLLRRRNTAETISTTKRRAKPLPLKESSHHHPSETRWFDLAERKREKRNVNKSFVGMACRGCAGETSQFCERYVLTKIRRKNTTHKTRLKCFSSCTKDNFTVSSFSSLRVCRSCSLCSSSLNPPSHRRRRRIGVPHGRKIPSNSKKKKIKTSTGNSQ